MKQMIVKVDDDFEIPEGLSLQTVGQLVGSKSWYNKILILCISDLSVDELSDAGFDVIAIEDEPLDIEEFTSHMNDIPEFDEEGEEIDSNPFSDLSSIQTFSGKRWTL